MRQFDADPARYAAPVSATTGVPTNWAGLARITLPVTGLQRSGGPALERAIGTVPGVGKTTVNVKKGRVFVDYDPARATVADLLEAVRSAGFTPDGQTLRLKVSGLYCGAQNGILYKNATALEQAAKLQAIIFDKTGTLTEGKPQVVEVMAAGNPLSQDELLQLVASAEQSSEHPLAQAVVDKAKAQNLDLESATNFEAIPGHGMKATVADKTLLVGNRKLMRDNNIILDGHGEHAASLEGAGRTVVYAACCRPVLSGLRAGPTPGDRCALDVRLIAVGGHQCPAAKAHPAGGDQG